MEFLSLDVDDIVVDLRRGAVFLRLKNSKTSKGQQSLVFHNSPLANIVVAATSSAIPRNVMRRAVALDG